MAIAIRAAGYLEGMLQNALQNDDMKTSVCPSHYMGLVELYRQTGDRRHLETAKLALELRYTLEHLLGAPHVRGRPEGEVF